jgi:FixJ family two-component response regulator
MQHSDTALSIAVIDPDETSRVSLTRLLLAHGYRTLSFVAMNDYAAHIREAGPVPLLLADVHEFLTMPSAQRRALCANSVVITLADGYRTKDIGRALVAGSFDYLVRPAPYTVLLATIAQASNRLRLQ